jgi:hypothetical protein
MNNKCPYENSMEHKGREQEAKIDKKAIANPFP